MSTHKNLSPADSHYDYRWEYPDAAKRESATGFRRTDLRLLALQLDDNTTWRLISISPVAWKEVGGGGTGGHTIQNAAGDTVTGETVQFGGLWTRIEDSKLKVSSLVFDLTRFFPTDKVNKVFSNLIDITSKSEDNHDVYLNLALRYIQENGIRLASLPPCTYLIKEGLDLDSLEGLDIYGYGAKILKHPDYPLPSDYETNTQPGGNDEPDFIKGSNIKSLRIHGVEFNGNYYNHRVMSYTPHMLMHGSYEFEFRDCVFSQIRTIWDFNKDNKKCGFVRCVAKDLAFGSDAIHYISNVSQVAGTPPDDTLLVKATMTKGWDSADMISGTGVPLAGKRRFQVRIVAGTPDKLQWCKKSGQADGTWSDWSEWSTPQDIPGTFIDGVLSQEEQDWYTQRSENDYTYATSWPPACPHPLLYNNNPSTPVIDQGHMFDIRDATVANPLLSVTFKTNTGHVNGTTFSIDWVETRGSFIVIQDVSTRLINDTNGVNITGVSVDSSLRFIRETGSFIDDGVQPGLNFYGQGFSSIGNNLIREIATVSDLMVTVVDTTGMVEEVGRVQSSEDNFVVDCNFGGGKRDGGIGIFGEQKNFKISNSYVSTISSRYMQSFKLHDSSCEYIENGPFSIDSDVDMYNTRFLETVGMSVFLAGKQTRLRIRECSFENFAKNNAGGIWNSAIGIAQNTCPTKFIDSLIENCTFINSSGNELFGIAQMGTFDLSGLTVSGLKTQGVTALHPDIKKVICTKDGVFDNDTIDFGEVSGTVNLDRRFGNRHKITIVGDTVLNFTDPLNQGELYLSIMNGGNYNITFPTSMDVRSFPLFDVGESILKQYYDGTKYWSRMINAVVLDNVKKYNADNSTGYLYGISPATIVNLLENSPAGIYPISFTGTLNTNGFACAGDISNQFALVLNGVGSLAANYGATSIIYSIGVRTADGVRIDVIASSGTFTRDSGSFLDEGFYEGMPITTAGFSTSGNNSNKIINTVTDLALTVTNTTGLANEAGNGNELIYGRGLTTTSNTGFTSMCIVLDGTRIVKHSHYKVIAKVGPGGLDEEIGLEIPELAGTSKKAISSVGMYTPSYHAGRFAFGGTDYDHANVIIENGIVNALGFKINGVTFSPGRRQIVINQNTELTGTDLYDDPIILLGGCTLTLPAPAEGRSCDIAYSGTSGATVNCVYSNYFEMMNGSTATSLSIANNYPKGLRISCNGYNQRWAVERIGPHGLVDHSDGSASLNGGPSVKAESCHTHDNVFYGRLDGADTPTSGNCTVTVNATNKTYTRSSGSFITDGFVAGGTVNWAGFTNSGNNGLKNIATLTATVMTVTSTTGLVDETGNGDENVIGAPTANIVINGSGMDQKNVANEFKQLIAAFDESSNIYTCDSATGTITLSEGGIFEIEVIDNVYCGLASSVVWVVPGVTDANDTWLTEYNDLATVCVLKTGQTEHMMYTSVKQLAAGATLRPKLTIYGSPGDNVSHLNNGFRIKIKRLRKI